MSALFVDRKAAEHDYLLLASRLTFAALRHAAFIEDMDASCCRCSLRISKGNDRVAQWYFTVRAGNAWRFNYPAGSPADHPRVCGERKTAMIAILIFNRVREERAKGATEIRALTRGYAPAWATITTLLAIMLLFLFGAGPVRGFAITSTGCRQLTRSTATHASELARSPLGEGGAVYHAALVLADPDRVASNVIAVDSVPAVFTITIGPYIVQISTMIAVIAARVHRLHGFRARSNGLGKVPSGMFARNHLCDLGRRGRDFPVKSRTEQQTEPARHVPPADGMRTTKARTGRTN